MKESGLGDRLYVGGYDLSGDTQSIKELSGQVGVLDVTDLTQSAYQRLHGERGGKLSWVSYFDTAANRSHPALSALPYSDVVLTYGHGTSIGGPAASLTAKIPNYDGNRGTDGSFLFACDGISNGFGLSWGVQLTAGIRTDVAATNGTGVDQTVASTAYGWTSHLHVIGITGTSVNVTLQDSADNATFATIGGAGFGAMAAPGAQRITSPGAFDVVRRYVRAITTGTFSSVSLLVNFTRNDAAAIF